MNNFHTQVEVLSSQKKTADALYDSAEDLVQKLAKIAKDYGKNGAYGSVINRSVSLLTKSKDEFFRNISDIIEEAYTKTQSIILDLETGDYLTLDFVAERIKDINIKEISAKLNALYKKTLEKQIK